VIPDSLLMVVVAIVGVMLVLGASTYAIDLQATRGAAERFRHLSLHDPVDRIAKPRRSRRTSSGDDIPAEQ
jgi:signal transduction histidine kinase